MATGSRSFLSPWSMVGGSSLALPWLAVDGMPLGVQLMGIPDTDVKLVRYEDLVSDPLATARDCARFLAVDPESPHFQKHVGTVPIVDANTRTLRIPSWRKNLSSSQVRMLDALLGDELEHFGYL